MKVDELKIFTNNLDKQIDFYATILELPVVNSTPEKTSFKIGDSILALQYSKDVFPSHFAFNIPSEKENQALYWLKERVDILTFDEKEIIDFSNWNAKAIYFYDLDKNIVEFISRRNLDITSDDKFTSKSILNISEVAMVSNQIQQTFQKLNKLKSIEVYSGDFDRFCAAGDENGLFIIVNNELKKWFPTGDLIEQSDFEIRGDFNFNYTNGEIIEIT